MSEQKLFYPAHSRLGYVSGTHCESPLLYHTVKDTTSLGCSLCRSRGLVKLITSPLSVRKVGGFVWEGYWFSPYYPLFTDQQVTRTFHRFCW